MTRAIRCLTVDDEPLAREAVRTHASRHPDLTVVGEASDGGAAIRAVERLRPDLLFLDIQMPEVDGFEVLHELMARGAAIPATIFVTAHDAYALRAFEVHALDYLLKPVREARFDETVRLARSRILAGQDSLAGDRLSSLLARGEIVSRKKVAVKVEGRITLLPLDQIEWIQAEGNYVRLHMPGRVCLVRETMSALEARLDPRRFVRIHRSAMINLDHLDHLRPWLTGEYIVTLLGGRELTLTRSYRRGLFRQIGREDL